MSGGRPLAHTCAAKEAWIMEGPDITRPATMNPKVSAGYHAQNPQLWSDVCVGNGLTIRNLKRALSNAEDRIVQLKNQVEQPSAGFDHIIIGDRNRALETKLLECQGTVHQRDAEIRGLRIKLLEYQQGFTRLNERLVKMIKQDLWQLPNRISLPELQVTENATTPGEMIDQLTHLLTILEEVQKDVYESNKNDYERKNAQELDGARAELADYKAKLSEVTTQLNKLTSELTTATGERTNLQDQLNNAQIERLENATKNSAMLQNLEKEIDELRKDIVNFQVEKRRLGDEITSLQATETELRQELAESRKETELKITEIAHLQSTTTNANTRLDSAAQTSPDRIEAKITFDHQQAPVKRPLSPTFGVDSQAQNSSRQSTMEDNPTLIHFTDSQFGSQASPTPHLDELFVGNRGTTPKVSTLRVTRTRRKGVNPMLDPIPPAAVEDQQSAPSTPVADAEKRRSKRSKVTKIA